MTTSHDEENIISEEQKKEMLDKLSPVMEDIMAIFFQRDVPPHVALSSLLTLALRITENIDPVLFKSLLSACLTANEAKSTLRLNISATNIEALN